LTKDGDDGWCSCARCTVLAKAHPRSLFCCNEAKSANTRCGRKLAKKFREHEELACICEHDDFEILALNRVAVSASARLLGDARRGLRFVDGEYENRQLRFAAYKSVTLWLYGRLGRRVRRVLPACIVSAIRRAFPNPDRVPYVNYRTPYERAMAAAASENSDIEVDDNIVESDHADDEDSGEDESQMQ